MAQVESFPPIATLQSRILILGSMPGRASLEADEYYAYPRNSFWPIIAALFKSPPLTNYTAKRAVIMDNHLALWDVIQNCWRPGSLDADIANPKPNDFPVFFSKHPKIRHVFFNGKTAEKQFHRHFGKTGLPVTLHPALPSTSPAHAGMRFEEKLFAWQQIKEVL